MSLMHTVDYFTEVKGRDAAVSNKGGSQNKTLNRRSPTQTHTCRVTPFYKVQSQAKLIWTLRVGWGLSLRAPLPGTAVCSRTWASLCACVYCVTTHRAANRYGLFFCMYVILPPKTRISAHTYTHGWTCTDMHVHTRLHPCSVTYTHTHSPANRHMHTLTHIDSHMQERVVP